MLYQLPNGRIINLTVEEFLNLSDNDIQDLNGMNVGDYPTSNWHGSAIKKDKKSTQQKEISLDYDQDSDEVGPSTVSLNNLTVDDIETINNIEDISEDPD